jgi:hypothetical protein
VAERLMQQRQQYVDALIVASTWDEARNIQGSIAAVDRALAVPKILQDEIRRRNK